MRGPAPRLWATLALVAACSLATSARANCPAGPAPEASYSITSEPIVAPIERRPIEVTTDRNGVANASVWEAPITVGPQLNVSFVEEPSAGARCWRPAQVAIRMVVRDARVVLASELEPGSCLERGALSGGRASHQAFLRAYEQTFEGFSSLILRLAAGFGWVEARDRGEAEQIFTRWFIANQQPYLQLAATSGQVGAIGAIAAGNAAAVRECSSYQADLGHFVAAEMMRRGMRKPTL